jgi:hypothetical protein
MLNMGLGYESTGRVHEHVCKINKLFEDLSGIQQMGTGPNAVSEKEQNLEYDNFEEDVEDVFRALAKDLGFKVKLKRRQS